ncbi:MAG: bifunctional methylenetetrahydrofolate dehydrogenase/methenyltetrahydrofolate cyclohydrolase FolD [Candidatus Krumholzibacteriia bacterium]
MSARILDGRSVARAVVEELRDRIAAESGGGRPPGLAAVLVGEDPASKVYVRNKLKTCERCGIESFLHQLPESVAEKQVAELLDALTEEERVDGILLQLPLPRRLDSQALLRRLDPRKDVDGLHPANLGKLLADDPSGFVPCTPAGVLELLGRCGVEVEGRRAVIVGRSNLVGKPLALLLLRRARLGNATVTVVHTKSREVPELVREAEILVAAAGSPRFVQGEWLRPAATVIDVGVHRLPDATGEGRTELVGDVDFAAAVQVAGAITPVPGGVGPMTVAMLMRNTTLAWSRNRRT